jgi:hypothetical protein
MTGSWPPGDFPNLTLANHGTTSPASKLYNCIAWASGNDNRWWWPDAANTGYWPPNVPREETVDAFIRAYGLHGYLPCSDGALEVGFEKVTIYAKRIDFDLVPTHAARQLENGHWTSKLGNCEDIEHAAVNDLIGPSYGAPVAFLRRLRPALLSQVY